MKIILQKFIAEAGYCSRRKAEELIRSGKVNVNDQTAELGMKVDDNDEVMINGKKIVKTDAKIYLAVNKPKGYVCTNRKFKGEQNIFDLIRTEENFTTSRLFCIGRLDKDSRGLVILTNDGDLTQKMTHPKFEHEKEYIINVKCQISNVKNIEEEFNKGVDIGEGDGIVKAKSVKFLGFDKEKKIMKYSIVLTEGKKRQIRRMFRAVGCEVVDLVRTRMGKIKLENLPEGKWKVLTINEMK